MSESESAKRSLLPTRARARASSISRGRNVLIGLVKRQTRVLCFALVMQLVQVALSLAPSIYCGAVIDVVAANSTSARNLPWLVRQTCESETCSFTSHLTPIVVAWVGRVAHVEQFRRPADNRIVAWDVTLNHRG